MALSKIPSYLQNEAALASGDLPAGSVIQVVSAETNSTVYTTSTSFVNTNLAASITPSSVSNKVLISFNIQVINPQGSRAMVTLMRGNVSLGTDLGSSNGNGIGNTYNSAGEIAGTISATFLDSPATTSSQTYTVAIRNEQGNYIYAADVGAQCSIVLQEIAG